MITIKHIIEALCGESAVDSRLMVTETVIDSRKAIPGALFVALSGEQTDGHRFVEAAFKNGAQFALIEDEINKDFRVLDLRSQKRGGRSVCQNRHSASAWMIRLKRCSRSPSSGEHCGN